MEHDAEDPLVADTESVAPLVAKGPKIDQKK